MVPHPWDVISVVPHDDYVLEVAFRDGSVKMYDMKPEMTYPAFAALRDLPLFFQAHVEYGAVIWNDDIDIAPEHLYECGVPVQVETMK